MKHVIELACGVRTIDTDTFPAVSRTHTEHYGLQQLLADSYASVTKKSHPDAVARRAEQNRKADARLAQLVSGAIGSAKSSVVAAMADEIAKLKAELELAKSVAAATPPVEPRKGKAA